MVIDSLENAENVVNPPSTPVARNNLISLDTNVLSESAKTIPIKKHPIILTIKVLYGIMEEMIELAISEIKYLNVPPIKLPIPTIKTDLIISSKLKLSNNHFLTCTPNSFSRI